MSIESKLNFLNETKNFIKNAITEQGVAVSTSDTFRSYANKIGEIKGSGKAVPDYMPNPTFPDIMQIIKNDATGYRKKYIALITDENPVMALTFANSIKTITSDGTEYTTTAVNHTWDTSKDITISEFGIESKARWYIVYYDNSLADTTAITPNVSKDALWVVFDTIQLAASSLFNGSRSLISFDLLNGANISISQYAGASIFSSASALQIIPSIDTSRFSSLTNTFATAVSLKIIKGILDFSLVTSVSSPFNVCYNLRNCKIKGIGISISFSTSTSLSHESLLYMIENAQDMTGKSSITITIGSGNLAKLSETEKAIATAKNITLA